MKFSLFAHMERVDGKASYLELYHNLVELVKMAESGGMTSFWTGEHHGMEFTITPNPFQTLIAIGKETRSIRLGTGTIVAPYWHPIKLAGEAALCDLLTEGRLELGIARGAYSFEYERLTPGMDAQQAGEKLREITPLLPKLWQGDCENFGKYYPFPKSTSCPKPFQPNGPPIWVAARDPSSHQFAIENRFNIQVTPLWQGDDEITSLMTRYQAAAESNGGVTKIMLLQHGYIGKDKADCDKGAELLSKFYNYFGAWFQNKRTVTEGKIEPISTAEMAANKMMSAENMASNLLIGNSTAVIERLKRYQAMGYDEFSLWLDNGLPPEQKRIQLQRFIDKIMPAF